jgi:uncharacterized protein YjiS (DUF1127 family)
MNTAHNAARSGWTTAPAWTVARLVRSVRRAFHGWLQRQRDRGELYQLNDRELRDIGVTRGEIGYIASNSSIDPRAARPQPSIMFLG